VAAARPATPDTASPAERGRARAASRTLAGSATGEGAARPATAAGTAGSDALAATASAAALDETAAGSLAALDAPMVGGVADRVVAEAMGRIRTATRAGVPGLESRIDDPELGSIRILVSGRPGETIHAELIARDPAAARELSAALDRALAAGASMPAGVDLHVRTDAPQRPSGANAHLGSQPGGGGRMAPDGQASHHGRDDAPAFAFGQDAGGGRSDPQPSGRERRLAPVPVAPGTRPAARSGAALDVRA